MTTWQIWAEGHRDNGGARGATLLGTAEGETFDEAVLAHMASLTPADAAFYSRIAEGNWRMWGCRLFADEASARELDDFWLR